MNFETQLNNYAKLIIACGVNLQANQELLINASVENADFVRRVVKEAYAHGAKAVNIDWQDDEIKRMHLENKSIDTLKEFPDYLSDLYNGCAKRNAAYLLINSSDPQALSGIDVNKLAALQAASQQALVDFRNQLDQMVNTWCIVAAPSLKWAEKVFPDKKGEEAINALWTSILSAVRCDQENPIAAWQKHKESFDDKKQALNTMQIKQLHFKNTKGTDIVIGLPNQYSFSGGGDETVNGIYHFPNMPTEEIFTSPNYRDVNGIVYATLPLNFQGSLIENFWMRFENGSVVDYGAEKGYDVLKVILERDEGSKRLGEVALIPFTSPINNMNILFYNTLFDENASCHLAVGRGFPEVIQNGLTKTKEELDALGINDSFMHVDFMIGSNDMNVTALTKDGQNVQIFKNGEWAF